MGWRGWKKATRPMEWPTPCFPRGRSHRCDRCPPQILLGRATRRPAARLQMWVRPRRIVYRHSTKCAARHPGRGAWVPDRREIRDAIVCTPQVRPHPTEHANNHLTTKLGALAPNRLGPPRTRQGDPPAPAWQTLQCDEQSPWYEVRAALDRHIATSRPAAATMGLGSRSRISPGYSDRSPPSAAPPALGTIRPDHPTSTSRCGGRRRCPEPVACAKSDRCRGPRNLCTRCAMPLR